MMMAMIMIMATVYSPPSMESLAVGQQAFPPPDIVDIIPPDIVPQYFPPPDNVP